MFASLSKFTSSFWTFSKKNLIVRSKTTLSICFASRYWSCEFCVKSLIIRTASCWDICREVKNQRYLHIDKTFMTEKHTLINLNQAWIFEEVFMIEINMIILKQQVSRFTSWAKTWYIIMRISKLSLRSLNLLIRCTRLMSNNSTCKISDFTYSMFNTF